VQSKRAWQPTGSFTPFRWPAFARKFENCKMHRISDLNQNHPSIAEQEFNRLLMRGSEAGAYRHLRANVYRDTI
jgi:hypothetical protein